MTQYPVLDHAHKEYLLFAAREQIYKKPGGWRDGSWSVQYPSNSDMSVGHVPSQRVYVAELITGGIVIVRTLWGDEVARGPLGWIWGTPIFQAYRASTAYAMKAAL